MLVNQNLWSEFGAVEELTEQAAETISGGYEVFTLYNYTNSTVYYTIDQTAFALDSNYHTTITTGSGTGEIVFDTDTRWDYYQPKTYDLSEGGVYKFESNNYTLGNPYDRDLYLA
jgi:hypothetical protein